MSICIFNMHISFYGNYWVYFLAFKLVVSDIVPARIILDRETGRSRGFGFVTFTSSEEASSAVQAMDGSVLSFLFLACLTELVD